MDSVIYNDKLTIVIVAFHSNLIIEDLISNIDKNIKIIVVENSCDKNLKLSLENKFNNVEVIIPKKNLGVGGGINLAFGRVKTKFLLNLNPDAIPNKDMINILLKKAEEIKSFSILAPSIKDFIYRKEDYLEKNIKENIHSMKYVIGAVVLINMKSLEKIGKFDENIFLYYEELDFYFRCLKSGLSIYLIDEAKTVHLGASSINKKFNKEISINRNWHYNWSKFYYYKKNYGYFYGIKKTVPNLTRAIKNYFFCIYKKDEINSSLHVAEIQGLLSSYILRKSSRRPKIDN